jgi:hypothetical protein
MPDSNIRSTKIQKWACEVVLWYGIVINTKWFLFLVNDSSEILTQYFWLGIKIDIDIGFLVFKENAPSCKNGVSDFLYLES